MPQSIANDIERRVALSLSVGRYLRASDRFHKVSREFTDACKTLRKHLGNEARFVVQVDFKHFLITSDSAGNFEVEPIESL